MGKMRGVKPEIARHELLYQLEKELHMPVRFAWVMLFTICDREGRFKWRPNAMKIDMLPWDDVDLSVILEAWQRHGMVVRYEVYGEQYGCIPTWHIHQNINNREAASVIPSPDQGRIFARNETGKPNGNQQENLNSTRASRVPDACPTREPSVDDACKDREARVLGPCGTPASGVQGPCRTVLGEVKGSEVKVKGKEDLSSNKPPDGGETDLNSILISFTEHWNTSVPWATIKRFTDRRSKLLKARLADPFFAENWRAAVAAIPTKPFLCGDNDSGWKANLDWFLCADSIVKLLEGHYDGQRNGLQRSKVPFTEPIQRSAAKPFVETPLTPEEIEWFERKAREKAARQAERSGY